MAADPLTWQDVALAGLNVIQVCFLAYIALMERRNNRRR
jgi:hypothetical protein